VTGCGRGGWRAGGWLMAADRAFDPYARG